jgi:hypothetical protein
MPWILHPEPVSRRREVKSRVFIPHTTCYHSSSDRQEGSVPHDSKLLLAVVTTAAITEWLRNGDMRKQVKSKDGRLSVRRSHLYLLNQN